jgi:flagellar hook-associated protein 3 FlgL
MGRISENMYFRSMLQGVRKAEERLYKVQRKAQTGLRVEKPSDDPSAAARGNLIKRNIARVEAMEKVADRAAIMTSAAESALSDGQNIISRARELTIAASSQSTISSDERETLAVEIDALNSELVSIANREVAGVYLFAGFNSDAPPYNNDLNVPGTFGFYAGDDNRRSVEVAPNVEVDMNISGNDAFRLDDNGTALSTDDRNIFHVLKDLSDDLRLNDVSSVHARIDELDDSHNKLARAQLEIGLNYASLLDAEPVRDTLIENFSEARAKLLEANLTESYSELMQARMALQSAIMQTTNILSTLQQTTMF